MLRLIKRSFFPVLAALLVLVAVPTAFAHAHPVSMTPTADAVVASPSSVAVHFSEELEPKFSSLKVSDAAGKAVGKAASVVDSKDAKLMSVALPSLPAGVYTVHWVAVAKDSHRMAGAYKFTVK